MLSFHARLHGDLEDMEYLVSISSGGDRMYWCGRRDELRSMLSVYNAYVRRATHGEPE